MILCDIGNSNADFYHNGKVWSLSHHQFKNYIPTETVYYICVNEELKKWLFGKNNFIDIEPYFELDTVYEGMGIDRIAACSMIDDGMIVDAGSAITVDIMSGGMHLGGFILPGLSAYQKAYAMISPRLDKTINPSVELDVLPQKTSDALSYGTIKSIVTILDISCKDKKIFFLGGDGKFFSIFFKKAIFDRTLIFRAMLNVIEKAHLG